MDRQFGSQCLPHLFSGSKTAKLAHGLKISPGKTAVEPRVDVRRQKVQQFFPIARPLIANLLELHDAPDHFPTRREHDGVDGAHTGPPGCSQQEKVSEKRFQGTISAPDSDEFQRLSLSGPAMDHPGAVDWGLQKSSRVKQRLCT